MSRRTHDRTGCGRRPRRPGAGARNPRPRLPRARAAASAEAAAGAYLPDPNRKYPERVLWGDEHVHTGWSMDAGVAGATLTPEDAVRFARGEQVKSNSGQWPSLSVRSTGWR